MLFAKMSNVGVRMEEGGNAELVGNRSACWCGTGVNLEECDFK